MTALEQVFQLEGKVALVTGGYGGIGETVCRGLACAGVPMLALSPSMPKVTIPGQPPLKQLPFPILNAW